MNIEKEKENYRYVADKGVIARAVIHFNNYSYFVLNNFKERA